jgi:hypothetical protein
MGAFTDTTFGYPDELNLSQATEVEVRIGSILRLPFRFRTGPVFSLDLPSDPLATVWLRNRVDVPEGTPWEDVQRLAENAGVLDVHESVRFPLDVLNTDALVVIEGQVFREQDLVKIRRGEMPSTLANRYSDTLRLFNEFVCAYVGATKQLFGGSPIRMFTDSEFGDTMRVYARIVCPRGYVLTEANALEMLNWRPGQVHLATKQYTGSWNDFPSAQIAGIGKHFRAQQQHAFFEIALKAKMAMVDRDPVVALVLACAALEGAHAAFLRQATQQQLSGAPKSDELLNNLLREQGIHTLFRLTPFLFMTPQQRPAADVLEGCRKGLEMRNDIMHIKTTGKQYKIRRHTFASLSDAYAAVLQAYDSFVAALTQLDEEPARSL